MKNNGRTCILPNLLFKCKKRLLKIKSHYDNACSEKPPKTLHIMF